MSFRPIALRSRQLLHQSEPCLFCQSRQFARSVHRPRPVQAASSSDLGTASPKQPRWSRDYATGPRVAPRRVREDIDRKNRQTFFKSVRGEGLLVKDPITCNKIVEDILSMRGNGETLNVVSLAKAYELAVEDLAGLAMVIHRIPDLQDMSRLSPSVHKPLAGLMLLACSKVKDPLAILLIMNGVLQSLTNNNSEARSKSKEFVSLFRPADIADCRKELEVIASAGDADAMNLLGQLLENEGQIQQARTLYEKALPLAETEFNPKHRTARSRFLVMVPVWNALGCMLVDRFPESRELAKAAFKKGALKADDPLSYYHLALFDEEKSAKWLQYMSKAAASGHTEAMYKIGHFYLNAQSDEGGCIKPALLKDRMLEVPLTFLKWKQNSSRKLAEEWFLVAAGRGYKPAAQELVKLYDSTENVEKVKAALLNLTEPPATGEVEQWPRLTEDARRRLLRSGLR